MKNGIKSKEFIKKISTFLMLVFVFLFFTFATENTVCMPKVITIADTFKETIRSPVSRPKQAAIPTARV